MKRCGIHCPGAVPDVRRYRGGLIGSTDLRPPGHQCQNELQASRTTRDSEVALQRSRNMGPDSIATGLSDPRRSCVPSASTSTCPGIISRDVWTIYYADPTQTVYGASTKQSASAWA
eukprot:m51a1_g12461 hypothetical protein (117) ;mRNA; r:756-4204